MLEARNISKHFAGVKALDNINLSLYPGKVNAIIGENGAGKSTLMKILSGVYDEYEGEIVYKGEVVRFKSTREAEGAGIAIIHQELNLVPYLSITENIFLGREITKAFDILDTKKMDTITKALLEGLHVDVHPHTKIAELKVGQQQMVEIAKALHCNADVIIMDEPTSAISDKEVDHLFAIIDQLRNEGKTIVYISHKLKELFRMADHFVVLRDGTTIDAGEMKNITQDELIKKMTGRKLALDKSGVSKNDKEVLLEVKNVYLKHPVVKNQNLLNNVSLELRKAEIVGIYGLMGAGRTELMETIFGLHPKASEGEVLVDGKKIKIKSPADAIAAGIALVPEDRKHQGLILHQTITSNISITVLEDLEKQGLIIDRSGERALSEKYIKELSIKTSSANNAAKNLSGGNQQKIVLAKWLATNPSILLLDEPTRGIDINAKSEIYALMQSLSAKGMAIIMVSSELPEILAVSDRVLVLCEGELTANIPIENADEATILKHAIHKN